MLTGSAQELPTSALAEWPLYNGLLALLWNADAIWYAGKG